MTRPAQGSSTALEQAVAARADAPQAAGMTLAQLIDREKPKLLQAIPHGALDPDRFVRILLTEVRKTPQLAACSQPSFLGAMYQSAQLGLEVGGALGQCFLTPRGGEVQFQIGYKGYVTLLGRHGILVEAREVRENDLFEFEFGTSPHLRHSWPKTGDRGEIVCYYGTAEFADGRKRFHVMTLDDIAKRRQRSDVKSDKGPWKQFPEAMSRKTVIRAMVPQLPLNAEVAQGLAADEAVVERDRAGEQTMHYIDVDTTPTGTASGASQDEVLEALNAIPDNAQRIACSRYLIANFGPAADLTEEMIPAVLTVINSWPDVIDSPGDVADTLPEPIRDLLGTIGTRQLMDEALGWLEDEYGPEPGKWDVEAVTLALDEWLQADPEDSPTTGAQAPAGAHEDPGPVDPAAGAPEGRTAPGSVVSDELLEDTRTRVDAWDDDTVDRVLRDWSLPVGGGVKTKRLRLVTHLAPLRAAGDPSATNLF